MEKIEPNSMIKKVIAFDDNAFIYGVPYKITIYDEDARKGILEGIRSLMFTHHGEPEGTDEIIKSLDKSLENGVNVIFKEFISNNSIAIFVLVTRNRDYDICIRIDYVEAQKTCDDIGMDDILKIESYGEY